MSRNKNDYETGERNAYRNNYKTVKGYFSNSQLKPTVIENFSLYGSLRGGSRNPNIEYSDQCYCQDANVRSNNGDGKC